MLKKDDIVEIKIEDVTHEGEGVGKIDGFALFVPKTVTGDVVKAKVISTKKAYGRALIEEIITPSPHRVEPKCSVYDDCGGCNLQHASYEHQMQIKRKIVSDAIKRIGGFEDVPVHETLSADSENYRNKMQAPVGIIEGKTVAGFYKPRSHDIVETESCTIQHSHNNHILNNIVKAVRELEIPPYEEKTGKGTIRHIMTRVGVATNQTMAVIVVTDKTFHKKGDLVTKIRKLLPKLTTLVINVNNKKTNVILGEESQVVFGPGYIEEISQDITFKISPLSFFQVNPKGMELLYNKAVEYASLTGEENVIDAYCGLGSISLFMAKKAREVIGIEVVPQAVADANENAKINKIENVKFIEGKAEEIMVDLAEKGEYNDVVVLDPPRKGCEESLLVAIKRMAPEKVVYVSCNPSTLARDLKILCQNEDYKLEEVQPVDMFPHTGHVEVVCKLSR
ncbi:23S rRNA (uracil(1939)-C(5))-methyltransferase RlmD [Alkalicella caledoniensis]|uniref:23S rRNA (Uracil(1939)-C(5))-methyltransferase RlmD n=1 Tax=Alkalicella caledoniensis TaxID=2731377 RepID=A0A7G9W9F0_ALKCA|nr:23S rRNA (uracil(1939)-C(5))-methyltransferase RlmD [Alkalicella caledoniensis]QNO15312.1 23S rRNA (uracil(1939)-C(5))-methyltransferase RlmD [Alkalicella caledoniensis]